jgi:hypothetical protein
MDNHLYMVPFVMTQLATSHGLWPCLRPSCSVEDVVIGLNLPVELFEISFQHISLVKICPY